MRGKPRHANEVAAILPDSLPLGPPTLLSSAFKLLSRSGDFPRVFSEECGIAGEKKREGKDQRVNGCKEQDHVHTRGAR